MEHETIGEMMQEYAERAVELARDFDVQLDFSESSVQGLERILAQLHEEHRAFTAGRNPGEAVEEQMVMMCKLWGGYFGEVVRRRWGGDWAMETYPGANFATLYQNPQLIELAKKIKSEPPCRVATVFSPSDPTLHPGFMWAYGIETVDGYANLYPKRYQDF